MIINLKKNSNFLIYIYRFIFCEQCEKIYDNYKFEYIDKKIKIQIIYIIFFIKNKIVNNYFKQFKKIINITILLNLIKYLFIKNMI